MGVLRTTYSPRESSRRHGLVAYIGCPSVCGKALTSSLVSMSDGTLLADSMRSAALRRASRMSAIASLEHDSAISTTW